METVITWPFQMFFSFCGIIAEFFVEKNCINFILLQMGVSIILITILALLAAHVRGAAALFGHKA